MNVEQLRSVAAAAAVSVAIACGLLAGSASGAMQSVKVSKNVCETTGGKRIAQIPGFPGERIDRRLLQDIKLLQRKYKIFITDGYSNDPVHSANGEHPMGLALDIVPNFAAGGDWNDIDRLAKFAEPRQNQVNAPFRWVGYNGDAGHGRGHHLHLSYSHSVTRPGKMADTVYTLRCPGSNDATPKPEHNSHSMSGGSRPDNTGGVGTGQNRGGDGGGGGKGGGIAPRIAQPFELAPIVAETGGVDG